MKMKELANQKMSDGCNCCESILWSYLKTQGIEAGDELYKIGSVFGGGVGSSREEICGALTGALMVLSMQDGRTFCSDSNDVLLEKGRELRDLFIEKIGPTKCSSLREQLELKNGVVDCKPVVQDCIGLLQTIESIG
jgi:C_GCAxxG_C_C family probable redox protein